MSWLPSFGEVLDGLSTAVDRFLARDETDRLRAQHARLVYQVTLREQEKAKAAARLEAAKLAAARAAAELEVYGPGDGDGDP
jgi:hypothetical protein